LLITQNRIIGTVTTFSVTHTHTPSLIPANRKNSPSPNLWENVNKDKRSVK